MNINQIFQIDGVCGDCGRISNRIEYIDAMRGFAMVLVVVCHIMNTCFVHTNIFYDVVNMQYQIPLFFLICGFFINKNEIITLRKIYTKFQLLVIPAIIMMCGKCVLFNIPILVALFSRYHAGYWFTFVLFEFILLFEFVRYICKLFKWGIHIELMLQLLVSIICIYFSKIVDVNIGRYTKLYLFTFQEFFSYIYLVIGYFVSVYYFQVLSLFKNEKAIGILVVALIIGNIIRYHFDFFNLSSSSTIILIPLVTCLGLLIIWKLFESFACLSVSTRTGKLLTRVGKRTLDVYFLHFFLLDMDLSVIGNFFEDNPSPLVEYLLAITLGIVITIVSLGLGHIIRLSPLTAKWLLGVKPA